MLKGTLDDFSLSDIFRLLCFAKKTGRLDVSRSAGTGNVFFRDGDVYFAQSGLNTEPLGQRLIRSGVIKERQLRKALDEQATTGERLGRILLASGAIRTEHLEAAVRNQIEDAAFELLRWELGEFTWEPDAVFDAEVAMSVSVESLIMEASRRVDELDVIARKIPSIDAVLTVVEDPPEGARELKIAPDEWRVLVLVDGERTVQEIVRRSSLDSFTTLRTLYGLVSTGLVELAGASRAPTLAEADVAEATARTLASEPIPVSGRAPSPTPPPAPSAPAPHAPRPAEEPVPVDHAPEPEPAEVPTAAEAEVLEPEPPAPPAERDEVVEEPAGISAAVEADDVEAAPSAAEAADEARQPEAPPGESDVVVVEKDANDTWFEDPEIPAASEEATVGDSGAEGSVSELLEEPELDFGAEPSEEEAAGLPEEITLPPSDTDAGTKVNRAAVVRELASLFNEDEEPARSRPGSRGGDSPRKGQKDADEEGPGKGGLISRLGRKGS
jgi:hypothetical protein